MNTSQSRVEDNIRRYGTHVTGVLIDTENGKPGFAYTTGNSLRGLPELLLIGDFPLTIAADILNQLSDRMAERQAPLEPEEGLGGRYPVRTRLCGPAAQSDYTLQATAYLGHREYQVMQILLPDQSGHYPGDAAIDPDYNVPLP